MNRFHLGRIGIANESTSIRPTLHDCVQAVVQVADTLIQDVLDGLGSMSSGQGGNNTFSCPFPVSREMTDLLISQEPAVRQTFVMQLEIAIGSASQDLTDRSETQVLDPQLLGIEQIDASVEFWLALQEVSRCVDDVLPMVDALVSGLSGWIRVEPLLNPVKSEVFARALLACLSRHVTDRSVRAALLIPCARLLGASLRQLYRELCEWMLSYGVEPAWPVGECLGSERSAPETEIRSSVYRRMGILGKFRQLLFCETESSPRSGGGQDFLPTVPFSYTALEDLNLIKPMMQRLMQRGSQFSGEIPRQQVASAGMPDESFRGKHLSQELGEAVLPLMLDSLLQDKRLLPAARDLIRRMEPALLRLVRSDPRFFSDHQHPARELLAWLIRHGQVGGYQNQRQHHRFLALVTRAIPVLQSPQVGAALFAAVLRQLEGEWTLDAMKLSSAVELEPHYS